MRSPFKAKPISRRSLMIGGGAAVGLVLAWGLWPREQPINLAAGEGEHVFNAFLKIAADGQVTVAVPQAEMGQGVYTVLPQILADELGADWTLVAVEPAPVHPAYSNKLALAEIEDNPGPVWLKDVERWTAARWGSPRRLQITTGSTSIRAFHDSFRNAGAMARALLAMAAVERWGNGGDWRECNAVAGHIERGAERLSFGTLAAEAATMTPPDALEWRDEPSRRLYGRSIPRLDAPPKLDGSARFGADVRLPKMVYASVRQGPPGDSRLAGYDEAAAKAVRGFLAVTNDVRWVAAVASDWWAAERALNLMKPRFETLGPLADSASIAAALDRALTGGEATAFHELGDVDEGLAGTDVVTADYAVPMTSHLSLEPMNATARVSGDRAEIWAPTQSVTIVRNAVAEALGFAPDQVTVFPTLLGGSFERMLDPAPAVQAALIARSMKRPVQLLWSRGEDMIQEAMHPPAKARLRARLAPDKTIAALDIRIAAPASARESWVRLLGEKAKPDEAELAAIAGAVPAYAIPALRVSHAPAEIGVPTGLQRGGAARASSFFLESFIDELAHKSGLDPLSFRLRLLADKPRHSEALKLAASLGGYAPFSGEIAQGLAVAETAGSVVAMMAEASVDKDGKIRLTRVVAAVDCGRAVNPDVVKQQIESGILHALATARDGAIGYAKGLPEPRELGGLNLPLLKDAPEIEVTLMESDAPIGGVSGIAVPPLAPALANALFMATGKRVRKLPFNGQALS